MAFTFRELKRRYFLARDAYRDLRAAGDLSVTMRAERREAGGFLVSSTLNLGDDELAVRFVVAMRPFLDPDPDSDYAYPKLLEHVSRTADMASVTELAHIRAAIAGNERGDMPIAVDAEEHGAAGLYRVVANAGFFDERVAETEAFRRLQATPVGLFVWFSFFSFAISMFPIVQRLFRLAYDIERQHEADNRLERRNGPCLYCRSTAGPFESEEHVIPEALGNDEAVLAPGAVCDPCNRKLGALDQCLADFSPIAFLRVLYVTQTKHGKLSKAEFRNVTAQRKTPRHIEIRAAAPSAITKNPDGSISYQLTLESKSRFSAHKLARAVYKLGLGMLAFKAGLDKAMEPQYDDARDFVVGVRRTFPNTLLVATQGMPRPTIETRISHDFGGTLVSLVVFGLRFAFNLEPIPKFDAARLPAGLPLQAFDLSTEPDNTVSDDRPCEAE